MNNFIEEKNEKKTINKNIRNNLHHLFAASEQYAWWIEMRIHSSASENSQRHAPPIHQITSAIFLSQICRIFEKHTHREPPHSYLPILAPSVLFELQILILILIANWRYLLLQLRIRKPFICVTFTINKTKDIWCMKKNVCLLFGWWSYQLMFICFEAFQFRSNVLL